MSSHNLLPLHPVRAVLALACVLAMAGCFGELEPCDFVADPDSDEASETRVSLTGSIGECKNPRVCFKDDDGDGVAQAFACDSREDSPINPDLADNYDIRFGDCDDEDDNNYPGNIEVCDGLDNDCVNGPNFDVEEDDADIEAGVLPSCAAGADVRLFLRGGGTLAEESLSGGATALHVTPGEPIFGEIKLRAFFPFAQVDHLAAVATASWAPPQEGFIPLWDPLGAEFDPPTEAPFDVVLDPSQVELTAPAANGQERTEYITIAASIGTGAPNLAALSAPSYCCEDGECPAPDPGDPEPDCAPVWSDMIETPTDAIIDLDLRDLTELDLGGCATFGAARVNELHQALRMGEEACEIGPPTGPLESPCLPFYRPKEIGCIIIPVVIEDEGDEG